MIAPMMIDPVWGGIASGLIIAVPAIIATISTSRTSRKAASGVAEIEQRKVDQETFDRVTTQWSAIALAANKRAADAEKAEELSDKRADQAEKRADIAEHRMDLVQVRLDRIEKNLSEHQKWDVKVLDAVRVIDPGFPPPPPLR